MSCPACFQGSTHDHATPQGEMTSIHGMECYVTPPHSQPVESPSTILFVCDAFGLKLINNKILADAYAKGTGMRVLMPACIPGGGVDVWVMSSMDQVLAPVDYLDFWGQINRVKHAIWCIGTFVPFMIKAHPSKAYPNVLEWTRKVKKDLPEGLKLGAAGFCWGGYVSTRLCTETATEGGEERLLDANFAAHPSVMKVPDMAIDGVKAHKVPSSFAIPESDGQFSLAAVDQAEAALTRLKEEGQQDLVYEFQVYKGVGHGFAVRGESKDKTILEAMEKAKQQAIDWFVKYL